VHELPAPSWSQQLEALGVAFQSPRRVLLVDDEPDNLHVLSALLDETCEVHTADSGARALALVDRGPAFAAVISDQRMPGMTGMELLIEMSRRSPDTVRMMLTAYSDLGPMIAAVNEGSVYRFFLKPWSPEEMRSAVADAVWLYEARAALQQVVGLLGNRKGELERTLVHLKRAQGEFLAAERLSTVGRFSAGIAHNIRNSLTVMMNLLELVQQNPAEQAVLGAAQRAFETLDALLRLVNDVNALGRGKLHSAARSPVEMEPFLDRLLGTFRSEPLGKDRQITATVDVSARVLVLDPNRIRQALLALLRSVSQATPPQLPIELDVRAPEKSKACFEVLSPPRGMSVAAAREHGAGRRAPGASAPTFAQIELGLEICRVVADAHGGRLVVRPRPEKRETAVQLWISRCDPEDTLS
jgi:CheY-like chemotaxis protein